MKRRNWLIAIALMAAVAALAASCSRGQTQNAGAPLRAVTIAAPQERQLDTALHAVGLLTPKDETRMSFKAGGVIESIKVEEGQIVKAGQILAVLKQTEIGASVEQARQATEKARRDLQRARALLADGVTTEEAVQDFTTAYNVATAAQSGTEFNAQHSRILASADGVVLRKLAEANEVVQAGQTVLVLGGERRGWVVRVGLADRDVVRVHLGDSARIEFDAWPGQVFSGTVSNIASAADAGTGTFTVEVRVEAGSARFVQGLVAKVAVATMSGGIVQVIPIQALLEANDKEAGVYVFDAGTQQVRRVTVQTGRMSGGHIEVLSGLPLNAQVVIDGAAFLENGESVRVVSK
jgi:RND family efflux transporter MFP subunit